MEGGGGGLGWEKQPFFVTYVHIFHTLSVLRVSEREHMKFIYCVKYAPSSHYACFRDLGL